MKGFNLMTNYRRNYLPGGTFFFTVNLFNRKQTLLIEHIDKLRTSFRIVLAEQPFVINAIVILPDHLHAILTLPPSDSDFSNRWRKIKANFSKSIYSNNHISKSRRSKGERSIWQRRFWEHTIRDQMDMQQHIDYIHFNPVKHGHCNKVSDWHYSSFHRFVNDGVYPEDWAGVVDEVMNAGER